METLYDLYETNPEMESGGGITLNFGAFTMSVRRAGGGNKKYTDLLRKMSQPFRRQIANDTFNPDKLNHLFMQCYARAVVLGWEGVVDRQGNPLEFNEANFVKVMTDLPDLWNAVQEECTKLANFRTENNTEDGETLGNSLSGTSNGEVPLTTS